MPTAQVEKAIDIPTGEYTGVISRNATAEPQGYKYHETYVVVDYEGEPELKLGVPFTISEKSALGQMLKRFGAKLETGVEIDTDTYLKAGTKVTFSIVKKKGKNTETEFSNIIADTFKPVV